MHNSDKVPDIMRVWQKMPHGNPVLRLSCNFKYDGVVFIYACRGKEHGDLQFLTRWLYEESCPHYVLFVGLIPDHGEERVSHHHAVDAIIR